MTYEQITVSRELLRQALDWFQCHKDKSMSRNNSEQLADEVSDALRIALEQPVQEPVAWMDREGDVYKELPTPYWCPPHTPLYAAPQAQQPLCPCKDRPADQCDEEWGPDCDLGNNEAHSKPAQQPQEPKCNPHPDAPHGFDRNASHTLGRYVCDCEGWEPEPQLLTDDKLRQIRKAKQGHDEFARAIEQAVLRKNGVVK